ncbi:uncharacterized protein LOC113322134 [Papaver somniferum]|uniref:uncharacterized protein LOC113322134 n=1 Tax=Papaver somniferum TaxID=3469 RepID=UPI000E6FFE1F|nr:uncharacterized protein LOC113322134 [Papaver somniferum]
MAKFCPIQILGPHPNGKNATGHHLYLFTDMHIKILIRSIMRIRLHRRFTIPVNIQIFLFFVTSAGSWSYFWILDFFPRIQTRLIPDILFVPGADREHRYCITPGCDERVSFMFGLCKCWEMMVQITIWMQLIYSSPCITLMGRILWNPELVSGIAVSVMLLCEVPAGSNSS